MKEPKSQYPRRMRARRLGKPGRSKEVQAHWDNVAELGCIVTGMKDDVTIHHVHGGSVAEYGIHKGFGMKTNDWLVIPIAREIHTGQFGIDAAFGVERWESKYGPQMYWLMVVCDKLDIDVFAKAGLVRPGGIDTQ